MKGIQLLFALQSVKYVTFFKSYVTPIVAKFMKFTILQLKESLRMKKGRWMMNNEVFLGDIKFQSPIFVLQI
jgi:hypothetical protein